MSTLRHGHATRWKFAHRNASGLIVWASGIGNVDPIAPGSSQHRELVAEQPWELNVLTDEGENNLLDVYFRALNAPTNFYIGLANSTIAEASTLANITEAAASNGYARQLVERSATGWPTLAGSVVTSSTETFTASGGSIGPVTDAFVCDVVSGTAGLLIVGTALSTTRTLADGESLDVSFDVTAS